ncbi:MAG: helix-turn-helix domain-containing protein [Bacteriovoracaceae bacterium]
MKKVKKSIRRTKEEIKSELPLLSLTIRNRREELGYTQEVLAMRAGVNLRFLKEFERGKKTVRMDKVMDLLNFLGLEIKVGPKARR